MVPNPRHREEREQQQHPPQKWRQTIAQADLDTLGMGIDHSIDCFGKQADGDGGILLVASGHRFSPQRAMRCIRFPKDFIDIPFLNDVQAHVDVIAEQAPDIHRLRFWQQTRSQKRGADRIRFLDHHFPSRFELGGRQAECERQDKRQQSQDGTHDRSNRGFDFVIGTTRSIPSHAIAEFDRNQDTTGNRTDEQPEGDGIQEYHVGSLKIDGAFVRDDSGR